MPRCIIQENCIECGACYQSCPVDAIVKTGNKYAIVADDCVDCGTCKRICKNQAVEGNEPTYANAG